jgi:hypothetical protein
MDSFSHPTDINRFSPEAPTHLRPDAIHAAYAEDNYLITASEEDADSFPCADALEADDFSDYASLGNLTTAGAVEFDITASEANEGAIEAADESEQPFAVAEPAVELFSDEEIADSSGAEDAAFPPLRESTEMPEARSEAPDVPHVDAETEESDWFGPDEVLLVDVGEPISPHPSREELASLAGRTREALQDTWEADPNRRLWPEAPTSYAQCARSLPQLQQGLVNVQDPIEHHMGALKFAPGLGINTISPHQWLRVGGVNIDITADQNGPIPMENGMVYATTPELAEVGLAYSTSYAWRLTYDNGVWREERIRDFEA